MTREEYSGDEAAVRAVHEAAFGRDAEARLVDRLRTDGLIVASVVCVTEEKIVASAVFSDLAVITPAGSIKAVALAPVAVTPMYQHRGFGSSVIVHGLDLCAELGYEAVFVLGDPAYYSRFGFSSEIATAVSGPYSSAGTAWMAMKLHASSVALQGAAHYPDAFSIVD